MIWFCAAGAYFVLDRMMESRLGIYWAAPMAAIGLCVKSPRAQLVAGLCFAGLMLWCIGRGSVADPGSPAGTPPRA